jgi:hypothetical protein
MKTLKLAISKEGLNLDEEKDKTPIELSTNIIKNVVLLWGNQQRGLSEEDRRLYYKISDAFDKAVKDNLEEIELEDQWIGFIRKCFKEAKLIPDNLLRRVEELIEGIKDR